MRNHDSGDLAMVTAFNRPEPYRAYYDGKTWRECGANDFCVNLPLTLRPLVVLDPDDRDAVAALLRAYGNQFTAWTPDADGTNIDRLQDALRSLTKPARIPEPGPWGVVEAGDPDTEYRCNWVRHEATHANWMNDDGICWDWSDLVDPVLVREGVS